jgi:hypothetical protein
VPAAAFTNGGGRTDKNKPLDESGLCQGSFQCRPCLEPGFEVAAHPAHQDSRRLGMLRNAQQRHADDAPVNFKLVQMTFVGGI